MYFENRLQIEWQILDLLHKLHSKFFDYFSYILSMLGSGVILFGIVLVIYYLVNKNTARRMGMIIGPSMIFNNVLKSLFAAKRPFEFEGKEYLRKLTEKMDGATGTSFPSGHAQVSSAVYTSAFISFKQLWIRILSITFIVLICLSRLYLGVHFPGDVLVGAVLGVIVTIILNILYTKIEDKMYKYIIFSIPIVIAIPFMVINFNVTDCADLFKVVGFSAAFNLSMFVEEKYINFCEDVPFKNKLLRLVIAGICGLAVYLTKFILPKHNIFQFLRYFLVVLTSFMIVPFFFKKEVKE